MYNHEIFRNSYTISSVHFKSNHFRFYFLEEASDIISGVCNAESCAVRLGIE